MGLRRLLRSFIVVVTTVTLGLATGLLATPSAGAAVCLDCEEPELPGPGGPSCPTIVATTDPALAPGNTYRVGRTVTATTGTWNTAAKTLKVWWYAGTAPVTPGTSYATPSSRTVSYTLKAADLGKPIRLMAVAYGTDTACTKSEYSAPGTATSLGDRPTTTAVPTIQGSLVVGATLTAQPGTWSPTPTSFGYSWRWDGDSAVRGTAQTYQLTGADLGKRIQLYVTPVLAGHEPTSLTRVTPGTVAAAAAPVPTTPPAVGATPAVFGTATVLDPGSWSPTPDSVSIQWLRDGTPIPGATDRSFVPGLAEVGTLLSVRVTARRAAHADGVAVVVAGRVQRAAAPVWAGGTVEVKGKGRTTLGKRIRTRWTAAKVRAALGAPDARVSYQWLRKGKPIAGATPAHKAVKKDRRKRLQVVITISVPGHDDLVLVSKAVKIKPRR
ncbi:hypothetical protein [Nocardioides sp. L-11A]|uniref:hypothetical protein n=1 Tax=Nocardioides sp. L-11A TaxID=3043848 RepID=UPI00249A44F9|nr:hypothetical protein QJ852_18735 [Nocardioides sp. L-11A]